jgi:hypothetical protein
MHNILVSPLSKFLGHGYGVYRHIREYFSLIVTVSFIDEGNQSTQRKPQTCRKPLTNVITMLYRVHLACVKECLKLANCTSINFRNPWQLCDLNGGNDFQYNLVEEGGCMFSEISEWHCNVTLYGSLHFLERLMNYIFFIMIYTECTWFSY